VVVKERSSFLKKRSKELYGLARAYPKRLGPASQKFFGSFFQKRTRFLIRR
jgi:hypothetical protein